MLSPGVNDIFRESEFWFRALADFAPVLIWSSDSTGQCTYFNQRWLQFTGRGLDDLLGTGWINDVHIDDRERILKEYVHAFQNRQQFQLEYRLKQHSAGYKWILDFGSPVYKADGTFLGYIGSCIDVAELHGKVSQDLAWRQKYEAVLAETNHERLPEQIAAAEVAVRDRLERASDPEEQRTLQEAISVLRTFKKDKLGFLE